MSCPFLGSVRLPKELSKPKEKARFLGYRTGRVCLDSLQDKTYEEACIGYARETKANIFIIVRGLSIEA
jgi:hypothetical protein